MTSTTRYIECAFPRRDIAAVVELLTREAPITCQMLWDLLPIEADSFHTKWNGNEVFAVLPPFEELTTENVVKTVQPGDVVLFGHPPGDRAAPAVLRNSMHRGYAELGFFYGSPARLFGPTGPLAATRVGRIVQGLDQLAEGARSMRRSGFDPMRLSHSQPGS